MNLTQRTLKARLRQFLTSQKFRNYPLRAVYRWCHWRIRRRFRAHSPVIMPFYQGLKIKLAWSSASSGIYFNDGFSDLSIAQLFIEFLKPGMIAFDCGAHIGEYTLLFSKLVGPEGQVHSFEPDVRILPYLQENVAMNNLQNVVLNNVALSEKEGAAGFALQPDPTMSSLTSLTDMETQGFEEISIPTIIIDAYVLSKKLPCVDALKIDVEGAEAMVITGAFRLLSELKPGLVFIECDNHDNAPVLRGIFTRLGYKAVIRKDDRHLHPHLVARRCGN